MSQDLRIKHTCPHIVACESLAIEDDLRTLRPVMPPASSAVLLFRNGRIIPRAGITTAVEITSLQAQPFEIETGDNDTFSISVNNGTTQSVTLPTGLSVSAQDIADALDSGLQGVSVSASEGRVVIQHDQRGPQATLAMKDGNAHSTLGFPSIRIYRGKQVVPGWTLVRDPISPVPTDRVLYFNQGLPSFDDIFEVTYVTQRDLCRRCGGLGIENDFRYNRNGEPLFVRNQFLLLQEVEKIVFTILGSNVFHTWYGTSLFELIGSKITRPGGGQLIETQLVSEIQAAIERYRDVKEKQSRIQEVTPAEQLRRIVSIEVRQDQNDPTVFRILVSLESRAGRLEEFEDTLIVVNQRVN